MHPDINYNSMSGFSLIEDMIFSLKRGVFQMKEGFVDIIFNYISI